MLSIQWWFMILTMETEQEIRVRLRLRTHTHYMRTTLFEQKPTPVLFWSNTAGHHGHPRIHVLYLPRDKLKLCKNADLVSNKKGPLVVWFIIGNWSDPGILFNWEYLQLMENPNNQRVEWDVDVFSQLKWRLDLFRFFLTPLPCIGDTQARTVSWSSSAVKGNTARATCPSWRLDLCFRGKRIGSFGRVVGGRGGSYHQLFWSDRYVSMEKNEREKQNVSPLGSYDSLGTGGKGVLFFT